jgi:hypothetical protein
MIATRLASFHLINKLLNIAHSRYATARGPAA